MIGVTVDATSFKKFLSEAAIRSGDLRPLMDAFGKHMMRSVRSNFDAGGRPEAWAPLKLWAVAPKGAKRTRWNKFRRQQGRARMGGPLVLTGDLRRNIGYVPESADLVLYAHPSEDAVKAPVHQWGTKKAGKHHNITIPARPYLVFQQEDIRHFRDLAGGWIRVGLNYLRSLGEDYGSTTGRRRG